MKNKDLSTLKYVVLGVLFMAVSVVTFFSMDYQSLSASVTTMSQATLPIVMMETPDGVKYNQLHGYTVQMDDSLLERSVTALESDKKLPIVIDTYGEEITGISYKVRGKDLSLIENTQVTDYTQSENEVEAVLNIKNLIENNTQYYLQIIISTKKHEEVNYYTSIICGTGFDIDNKLEFVKDFSSKSIDSSQVSRIAKYLEPKSSADNSNYGSVNINSKQTVISWGDIYPFVEGEIIPQLDSINSEGAKISINYVMGAENEYSTYDTYYVNESYELGVNSKKDIYLIDYQRSANQVFDSRDDISGTKINIGIRDNTDVTTMTSSDGEYVYFVNEGKLWCYSTEDNMFTEVFSFTSSDSDNVRENYQQYSIRIMSVSDNGDCDFLVCGYMNRGEHEGETGVDHFYYNYKENVTNERVYIPINKPYNAMSQTAGSIAYVNDKGIFYIMIDDTLYAINLTNMEVMVEVSNLKDRTYAVSKNGRSIAYSLDEGNDYCEAIRVFNMEKGTDYEIHAEDGKLLKVIGYINSDFIYGSANQNDIIEGNVLAMGNIDIIDDEYNVIKVYDEPGIYVSEADVDNLRLNLKRVVKNGNGGFEDTTSDQLINREENNSSSLVSVDVVNSDNRLKEVVLVLNKKISSTESTTMRYANNIEYIKNQKFSLN